MKHRSDRRRKGCTNQQPPQRGGAVPDPVWVGSKWLLAFPRVQSPWGHPFVFSLCCSLNDRSRAAYSFFKIGRLFSLSRFSCPCLSLLRLRILLLLLMSGNVHPNLGPIFPCSVCAGNVTWWGKSQMGPSKVLTTFPLHIQSSWQLSLLGCPPCRNTVTPFPDSSDMYTSTVQSGPPLLMQHSRSIHVSKPLIPRLPIIYIFSL